MAMVPMMVVAPMMTPSRLLTSFLPCSSLALANSLARQV